MHGYRRWMLIIDIVKKLIATEQTTSQRANHYLNPSDHIWVDESMSCCWYGHVVGLWINMSLPQEYVAIFREFKSRLQINLVVERCQPSCWWWQWYSKQRWLVAGNKGLGQSGICFASIRAAKLLFGNGQRFIRVLKTATKGFPKILISSVKQALYRHDKFIALISKHVNDITISQQGRVAKIYCSTCNAIEKHNRYSWHDDLRVEKISKHHTIGQWGGRIRQFFRLWLWILGLCCLNACRNRTDHVQLNQKEFYSELTEARGAHWQLLQPDRRFVGAKVLLHPQVCCHFKQRRAEWSGWLKLKVTVQECLFISLLWTSGSRRTAGIRRYQGRCKIFRRGPHGHAPPILIMAATVDTIGE